ncbi:sodium:proton symporter [Clostridiales bacterium PH28_bin88]|nr:sodium:proton symporter [Clostridiales bacterium PH28_bin88]
MVKKIFYFPAQNLVTVIPAVLAIAFLVGSFYQTQVLKNYILPATFLMIYPTMIGFKLVEAVNFSHARVLLWSLGLNFIVIPLVAYALGSAFFASEPQLFAGLAIASLLPTSGMTISWTMLSKGNVPAAVKITVVSLVLGSLLAPWYLLVMVGKFVPVEVVQIFKTIAVVVFLPLALGHFTHKAVLRRYSPQEFQQKIKPVLPSLSVWAMLFIIFSSASMKAKMILSQPNLLMNSLVVLALFYLANFVLSTVVGRYALNKPDAFALVYGTVMRNLSISLGVAIQAFGPKAALIVTLAFILQVQGAAWYGKIAQRFKVFRESGRETELTPAVGPGRA